MHTYTHPLIKGSRELECVESVSLDSKHFLHSLFNSLNSLDGLDMCMHGRATSNPGANDASELRGTHI